MTEAPAISTALQGALGGGWSVRALAASGFCDTFRADAADGTALFVKALPAAGGDLLDAEADGLAALRETETVRVPAVIGCWRDAAHDRALLALQWLDLVPPDAGFGARLGTALGALHRAMPPAGAGRYGWRRDNFIGTTPQRNSWRDDWIGFQRSERLGALRRRLDGRASRELLDAVAAVEAALPRLFDDGHAPRASLIHGDLWSGNWGMLADGSPAIYDPAVSCSDAEAELAMMELFGVPPAGFQPAYRTAAGLHAGYARRRGAYQLYHLLNHALLFGGGYAAQALALARRLTT